MFEQLENIKPLYVLLAGGGGGGGFLLKWAWDRYRQSRLDTWGQAQQIVDDLRASLEEAQKMNAAKDNTIVDLHGKLEGERKQKWEAQDSAAQLKRQNKLLALQLEELQDQTHQVEEVLERNRTLSAVCSELLQHVYRCEQRARKLERNVVYLRDLVEGHPTQEVEWEDLEPADPEDLEHLEDLIKPPADHSGEIERARVELHKAQAELDEAKGEDDG